MKIIKKRPDSFFYQGEKKIGILLIHGFTGSPAEIKLLGENLNGHGYTVYAPLLAGHGRTPEEMAKTNKDDWWKSVLDAYDYLKNKGYEKIVAIGLSMGGTLSLKLALNKPLLAVISLAAPIYIYDRKIILVKWLKYFKQYEIKSKKADHIQQHLLSYDRTPVVCAESLHKLIKEVKNNLVNITVPVLVMQGKKDETVIPKSAKYIYDNVRPGIKELRWYEESSHIMTLDHEREIIFADILSFLEKISI